MNKEGIEHNTKPRPERTKHHFGKGLDDKFCGGEDVCLTSHIIYGRSISNKCAPPNYLKGKGMKCNRKYYFYILLVMFLIDFFGSLSGSSLSHFHMRHTVCLIPEFYK